MKKHTIIYLCSFIPIIISIICLFSQSYAAALYIFLLGIPVFFIGFRMYFSILLRHDTMELDKRYTARDILETVEQVFDSSRKWKGATGSGQVNRIYSRMAGLVNGPVLSVKLSEKYNEKWEIDIWVSHYEKTQQQFSVPKVGGYVVDIKDEIFTALTKFI